MAKSFWTELLVTALFVLFIGGIVAYGLGMLFGMAAAVPMWAAIQLMIGVVLAVVLAKYGEIDNSNLFQFVILLGVVGVLGTVLTSVLPAIAPFILVAGTAFTINGLVWTFVYILAAEAVKNKVM